MVTATLGHRHVDTETGELIETAEDLARSVLAGTSLDPDAPLQPTLPLFEGFQVWKAEVSFSGSYDLDLTDEEYRRLTDILGLGEPVELTVRATVVGVSHKATDVEAREAKRKVVLKVEEVERA